MPGIDRIQIYGERCSGTNYLEHLLKENLRFIRFPWNYGWKHGFPPLDMVDSDSCLFIVIHRHPYDWIRSLYMQPWHAARELRQLDFSGFIRHEWWCVWDQHAYKQPGDPLYGMEMIQERCPVTGRRFPNVLQMRNAKLKAWLELESRVANCIQLRYEDVDSNPTEYLATLSERFSIRRKKILCDITGSRGSGVPFRRKHYDRITASDLDYIRNELDTAIENRIGYDLSGLPEDR